MDIIYKNNRSKPIHATGLFLCPLKTLENLWFSEVFRGYGRRPVEWSGLKTESSKDGFLYIWDKVFKNEPSKICGWQNLKFVEDSL